MNTQHILEPWPEFEKHPGAYCGKGKGCDAVAITREEYNRARACVNACVGTTTADLEQIASHGGWNHISVDWKLEQERVEQQRDDLLDAMHQAIFDLRTHGAVIRMLREAIAKAKGGV